MNELRFKEITQVVTMENLAAKFDQLKRSYVKISIFIILNVVRRSRKAIMNFLSHQEEYGTKQSSGRPSKLNGREKG
uniref:Transposase n=1 Tax=Heterorhabditis bacteriophora TaxID=37862 RepID=A0A1I7XFS8_HETBA